MNKKFYISDMHFGHANIIGLDNRPFVSTEDMEKKLIKNWNSVVDNGDIVYILGDFCWSRVANVWINILDQLNGTKHLIKGNHDMKVLPKNLACKFASVSDYKTIHDEDKTVIMCHYPMPFYKGDYNPNTYMLFGHIHTTEEEDMMNHIISYIKENDLRERGKDLVNMLNVGCMMPYMDYTPKTLDQLVEVIKRRNI